MDSILIIGIATVLFVLSFEAILAYLVWYASVVSGKILFIALAYILVAVFNIGLGVLIKGK